MTDKNLYMDIHVIQTVPSSNINRDDSGSPKTAYYGGVTRARVSSQSWKHAIRMALKNKGIDTGIRTIDLVGIFSKSLKELDSNLDDDAIESLAEALSVRVIGKVQPVVSKKSTKKGTAAEDDGKKSVLVMLSKGQIRKLAEFALNHKDDVIDNPKINTALNLPEYKDEVNSILTQNKSLDLALFGRMLASSPELNIDATSQVAHAISTHEVVPEFDYFTAMDDFHPEQAGARMLGTIMFDSATLYRYANVNVKELAKSLDTESVSKAVSEFISAFISSMPTGKENTFANKTVPSYVMVTFREDTPVNLVSAFEKAVSSQNGFVEPSIKALESEYQRVQGFVEKPIANIILTDYQSGTLSDVDNNYVPTLTNLLDESEKVVKESETEE